MKMKKEIIVSEVDWSEVNQTIVKLKRRIKINWRKK